MSRAVLIGENLLGFQVGKFLVAIVAKEQRFASIADENHGVVGDCELIHISLLKPRPRRRRGCRGVHYQRPTRFFSFDADQFPQIGRDGSLFRGRPRVPKPAVERVEKRFGGFRDHRAGREDRLRAGGFQRLIVLRRYDASDHDHNVRAAVLFQLGLELGHQRRMRAGERRDAENVHVVLDRLARGFRGVANSGPISTSKPISAKAEAITFWPRSWPSWPIFATRMREPATFVLLDSATRFCTRSTASDIPTSRPVNARRSTRARLDGGETCSNATNLADRRLGARGIDGKRERIAVAAGSVARERGQRLGDGLRITLALKAADFSICN